MNTPACTYVRVMDVVDYRWTLPRKPVFNPRAFHTGLVVEWVTLVLPRYNHVTKIPYSSSSSWKTSIMEPFKPRPLHLQSRPSSCVPLLFKQAYKMSASGSTFAVRKLYSAAVCFVTRRVLNPLNPELNPIYYLLALLGAHHFLHVSRIGVKSLIFRLLMSYIHGAPILDVSRSHTTTQHSR